LYWTELAVEYRRTMRLPTRASPLGRRRTRTNRAGGAHPDAQIDRPWGDSDDGWTRASGCTCDPDQHAMRSKVEKQKRKARNGRIELEGGGKGGGIGAADPAAGRPKRRCYRRRQPHRCGVGRQGVPIGAPAQTPPARQSPWRDSLRWGRAHQALSSEPLQHPGDGRQIRCSEKIPISTSFGNRTCSSRSIR
jgi:hypothetical protein